MSLTKKQLFTLIFTFGIIFAIPVAIYLTRQKQGIKPQALQGKANFLLSSSVGVSATAGQNIDVLVSLQLTDPALKVSGVDFVLLYDKNLLDVGNIVPEVISVHPDAAFTDAPIVTSGGSFDNQFNFVRVTEVARLADNLLHGGTTTAISLAKITFRGRAPGSAAIKFPDDNKYLQVSGTGTYVAPTGGPACQPLPANCVNNYPNCIANMGLPVGGWCPLPTVTPGGPTPTPIPGLVGFWHLDDIASLITDFSGNLNNGTATGTALVDAISGKGRSFNGTSDNIQIPNSASLNSPSVSFGTWFKTNSLSKTWQSIFWKGNSGDCTTNCENRQYTLWLNSSGSLHVGATSVNNIGVGQTVINTPAGIVTPGTWYYVFVVIDGANGNMKLYLNGVEWGSNNTFGTSGIRTTTGSLYLGANPTWDSYFNGIIDEARVYNRALSVTDVNNLYKSYTIPGPTIPPLDNSTPTPIPATATPVLPTATTAPNQPTNTPIPPTSVPGVPLASIIGTGNTLISVGGSALYDVQGTETGGNLSSLGIYISSTTSQHWYRVNSDATLNDCNTQACGGDITCSGASCSGSRIFRPTASGSYYVVANAYDNSGPKCSGNPFVTYPINGYTACGNPLTNSYTTLTVSAQPTSPPIYGQSGYYSQGSYGYSEGSYRDDRCVGPDC